MIKKIIDIYKKLENKYFYSKLHKFFRLAPIAALIISFTMGYKKPDEITSKYKAVDVAVDYMDALYEVESKEILIKKDSDKIAKDLYQSSLNQDFKTLEDKEKKKELIKKSIREKLSEENQIPPLLLSMLLFLGFYIYLTFLNKYTIKRQKKRYLKHNLYSFFKVLTTEMKPHLYPKLKLDKENKSFVINNFTF